MTDEPLADEHWRAPVVSSDVVFPGMIWDVRRDVFDLGEAGLLTREWLDHPGAVVVVALDPDDRILLIQQYRHPAGVKEWELPAGLLDVAGEAPRDAAARELAEEADLIAEEWHVLSDFLSSPGFTNEALRIFLARGIRPVPEAERHVRTGEELGMPTRWVPLEDALDAVLAGRIRNPSCVIGILVAAAARDRDWSTLRPADAPWPDKDL